MRTFSRHGFRGSTTRRLARAGGITEVTLFRYFPTKEKLFGAVLDKYSVLPVLRAEVLRSRSGGSPEATVRHIGRKFLAILHERQDIIRLMLSEAATNRRQAAMLFRQGPGRFIQEMTKLLSAMKRRREIRSIDLALAARAFLGIFFSFTIIREIFLDEKIKPMALNKVADRLSDLLWHGLRPDRSGRRRGKRK
ncbi:helix-turn-helix transcriptional regulator [Candidatus Sumerlaeota bacterium]|nr:helix-turn-helix transcriptional regulator [Candidatus Sumerlaeota bacterium]